MAGTGDISSELDDKKRILTFVRTLNVVNAQNNPDIGMKINLLDSLWEELEVKAKDDAIKKIGIILARMSPYRTKYSKAIMEGTLPGKTNLSQLYSYTKEYTLALRKEAHKQLNVKDGE